MLAAAKRDEDQPDAALRPQTLAEFIGQAKVRSNLKVFIDAAAGRREALDHVLFAGPPGLGKTTLAQIVARELGVSFRATSGPGDRQGRRSRGAPHQSRGPRRAVHRRDPPALARGGGNPLSRHGGLPARPHHRRGAGGALGAHRCRPLHADRRHHAHRAPDDAARVSASAFPSGSSSTRWRSWRRSCGAARGCSACR